MAIDKIAEKAETVTSLGTQCGEGWLLAGEMTELLDSGVENIVCLQPSPACRTTSPARV